MDERYTVTLEYTGHISMKPRYVLRFCGDFIGDSETMEGARILEVEHVALRGFDLVAKVGCVLWVCIGKKHRIVYGAEIKVTGDSLKASHFFGECVHHQAECDNKF